MSSLRALREEQMHGLKEYLHCLTEPRSSDSAERAIQDSILKSQETKYAVAAYEWLCAKWDAGDWRKKNKRQPKLSPKTNHSRKEFTV